MVVPVPTENYLKHLRVDQMLRCAALRMWDMLATVDGNKDLWKLTTFNKMKEITKQRKRSGTHTLRRPTDDNAEREQPGRWGGQIRVSGKEWKDMKLGWLFVDIAYIYAPRWSIKGWMPGQIDDFYIWCYLKVPDSTQSGAVTFKNLKNHVYIII